MREYNGKILRVCRVQRRVLITKGRVEWPQFWFEHGSLMVSFCISGCLAMALNISAVAGEGGEVLLL